MLGGSLTMTSSLSLSSLLKPIQALAVASNINEFLHLPSSTSLPAHPSPLININPPLSSLNYTSIPQANNDYMFTCSGQAYGYFHNSEISACLDATETIAAGRERYTFAMRGTPEYDEDAYPLPWRWMSGRFIFTFPSRIFKIGLSLSVSIN